MHIYYRKRREQESYFHVRRTIRIVVVGSEFVGKTAIISRFTSSNFPKKYVPTVEDMFRLTVNEVVIFLTVISAEIM